MDEAVTRPSESHDESRTAAESVTLEDVRLWCEREEKTLRMQHPPDGALPAEQERELASLGVSTMIGALRRWAYLKHLFRTLHEPTVSTVDKQEAARQMLRREPVVVHLPNRSVKVTARSYAAMYEIATHAKRLRMIERDIARIAELFDVAEAIAVETGSNAQRRRMKRLEELHGRMYAEAQLHRRAIYAHALTTSGAPAESIEGAPAWCDELDANDDAALLAGLLEAGIGRLQRLGPRPPSKAGSATESEDFGWASLFASIERTLKARPAEFFDRDLFQLLAWDRAAAVSAKSDDELMEL